MLWVLLLLFLLLRWLLRLLQTWKAAITMDSVFSNSASTLASSGEPLGAAMGWCWWLLTTCWAHSERRASDLICCC